jgi:hypothetical protein
MFNTDPSYWNALWRQCVWKDWVSLNQCPTKSVYTQVPNNVIDTRVVKCTILGMYLSINSVFLVESIGIVSKEFTMFARLSFSFGPVFSSELNSFNFYDRELIRSVFLDFLPRRTSLLVQHAFHVLRMLTAQFKLRGWVEVTFWMETKMDAPRRMFLTIWFPRKRI